MMFYYTVFVILFCLSLYEIFFKVNKRIKNAAELLVLTLLILISSVRGDGIGDYNNYKMLFESTNTDVNVITSILQPNMRLSEPLYSILNYIIKYFGGSFQTLVFMEALFVNTLMYIICKKIMRSVQENAAGKDYTLTVFFIMWCLGLYNVIIIRQTLAVSVCWFSIKYIRKRNLKGFLICWLAAVCLHQSEILWLPSYWIYHFNVRKPVIRYQFMLALLCAGAAGAVFVKPLAPYIPGVAGEKVRMYFSMGLDSFGLDYSVAFIFLKTFMNIGVILAMLVFLFRSLKDEKLFCGLYNLYLTGAALVLATSFVSNQLSRVAQAYTMISIFLFPYLFRLKSGRNSKMVLFMMFSFYMGIRLYINIHGSTVLMQGYPVWRS